MCFSKIVLGLHLMILCCQQTYGSISSFGPTGLVAATKPLHLACKINAFNAGEAATLTRNGSLINTCFQSNVCTEGGTKTINGVTFTFSGDSQGIYLMISSLPESEIGLVYVCDKNGPQEYIISISSVDTECGWCVFDCDDETWCIVFIVFGLLFGTQIIIIIILIVCGIDWDVACVLVCWIWCCILCCCKKNYERDPESYNTDSLHQEWNNTDRLHSRCCTRGGQFYKQHLTCLNFDGRVSNESTNKQPHTGRNMEKKRPLPAIGERH